MQNKCETLKCIGNENGYCTWSDIPYELPCYDEKTNQLTYFENEED